MKFGDLNKFVDKIFQVFLPPAGVRSGLALFEHVILKFVEAEFALFNFLADARVPGTVTLFDKFRQAPIPANGGGNLQAAGERVHAADVGVEEIERLETFPAD